MRTRKKELEQNRKEKSGESDRNIYGSLATGDGGEAGVVNGQTTLQKSAARPSMSSTSSEEQDNSSNAAIKLNSQPAIQLQEQIKDVICSKPILDRLVALIADAIMEKVSQDVYASINHDLEVKNKEVRSLENKIQKLERQFVAMENAQEEQAQYSRRNCLLIYGVAEQNGEVTDEVALQLLNSKLEVDVKATDIDRSHRLFAKKRTSDDEARPQPRPLIIKFARYNVRQRVYAAKTKLKKTQIFIREHLTAARQQIMRETLKCPSIAKAWTIDGKIRALTKDNAVVSVRTLNDLDRL